jgi:uncharacterized membrane protein (DUF4010 family)
MTSSPVFTLREALSKVPEATRVALKVVRERSKRHRRAPPDSSDTSLKSVSKFCLGLIDLLFDFLAVLLDEVIGNIAVAIDDLHGLARSDAYHAGMEALRKVACDLQQTCVRMSELQMHHQGSIGHD